MIGSRFRIVRMIVSPGEIFLQHIPIDHFVIRLLKGKEQDDRMAQLRRIAFLAGHFNKGIHIACPDLGVTAPGIETAADRGARHTVDYMQGIIVLNILR